MFKLSHPLCNAEPGQEGAGGAPQNNAASTVSPAAGAPAGGAVDVQAQIKAAVAKRDAEFAEQLKAATGHSDLKSLTDEQLKQQGKLQELAENKAAEADKYKSKFEQTQIANALLSAATDAVNPAIVSSLLAGKAAVDEQGNVSIDGKTVAEAVKQLLADNPYLAKAQGGTGSGAPQNLKTAMQDKSALSALERLKAARQQSK